MNGISNESSKDNQIDIKRIDSTQAISTQQDDGMNLALGIPNYSKSIAPSDQDTWRN